MEWARNVVVLWRVFTTAATGQGLHSCDCDDDDVNTDAVKWADSPGGAAKAAAPDQADGAIDKGAQALKDKI